MTQPLIAAFVGDLLDDLQKLLAHLGGDDVHRAAGHVPGRERDAVGIGLEAEIGEVHECLCDLKGDGPASRS